MKETRLLTHTLPNGLQVVGQRVADFQTVAVIFYMRTGSRDEGDLIPAGVAHFLEHMAFRSSQIRSGLRLIQAFERIGADINAATFSDATLYYASALGEHLDQMLALFSEMMAPRLLQEEFDPEKAAILNEILGDEEEPDAVVHTLMRETYFQDYSLAHDVLGTYESIQKTQPFHLRDFWEQRYVANNLLISVAGNFQEEHFLALVDQYCGQWRTGHIHRNVISHQLPTPRRKVMVNPHLQQQFFMLTMPAVPKHDPDYLAALLGARVLGKRLYWSILYLGLAEDLEVNLWTDAYDILHQTNMLTIEVNTLPELVPTVLEKIQYELRHLLEDGVTEAELRRVKNVRQSGRVIASEEMLERAWTLAEQWDFEGRILSIDEELAGIEWIGSEDVMRAFHRFTPLERQVLVSTGPLEDDAFA